MKFLLLQIFLLFIFCNSYIKADESSGDENELIELPVENPCAKYKCGHGRQCVIHNDTREARCDCISKCPSNSDLRRRVCSNLNETWESDCHLHRERCLCVEGINGECDETIKHMHIDYYGECKDIQECQGSELEDFPRRMREWLNMIMNKNENSRNNHEKTESDKISENWIDAVIWKFCDLDTHPSDRSVSRHELFPLRAPLLSMEPCISTFLDSCDPNDDHKITLEEWGKCLGSTQSELEYKCAEFTRKSPK